MSVLAVSVRVPHCQSRKLACRRAGTAIRPDDVHGPDGTAYPASFSTFAQVGSLRQLLGPEFDLSPVQGDPTRSVYVFDTVVPISALAAAAVPEPRSYALFAIGLAALLLRRGWLKPPEQANLCVGCEPGCDCHHPLRLGWTHRAKGWHKAA